MAEIQYIKMGEKIVGVQQVESVDVDSKATVLYIKVEEAAEAEFIKNIEYDIAELKKDISNRQAQLATLEAKLIKVNTDIAKVVEPIVEPIGAK